MVLPSRVSAGVPGLRMLFVIFTLLSLASSFPFHPDRLDSQLNSVDAPRHVKRDVYTFPRVTYGDTCSEAQKTYIEQELNEMIDLLQTTTRNINNLRLHLEQRAQPQNWGANYDYISKLLATWQAYMGNIKLTRQTQSYQWNQHLYTFTEAIDKMDHVIGIYNVILNKLYFGGPAVLFHCNDEHYQLTTPPAGEDQTRRWYLDTRPVGVSEGLRHLHATGRLCHEDDGLQGWGIQNQINGKDEVCICPAAFARAATSQKLEDIANTQNALNGKKIDDLKLRAIVGSVLHELTHLPGVMGTPTADLRYNINPGGGRPAMKGAAYRGAGVRALAAGHPLLTAQNADSLAYLAIASWYDACNWSMDICGTAVDKLRQGNKFERFDFD
ncbi:hypothetical protein BDV09DRAFT_201328 [Aspergillus tetrazonus]